MKCIIAHRFGDIEEVIDVQEDAPKPEIKRKSGEMLVKVQAVSLSPGDYRMLDGSTDLIKKPPSFPYIPGGDLCGIVEEVDDIDSCPFQVGDSIIATWDVYGIGALAEYALVKPKMAAFKPPNMSALEGAALANSAVHAMIGIEKSGLKAGERVLVLGGSGGVGNAIIQLAKQTGCSFIAATSTHLEFLSKLNVDRIIDYTKENWWDIAEFSSNPFDKIFDCAEGYTAYQKATQNKTLKRGQDGGMFYAIHQDWQIDIHSIKDIIAFLGKMVCRQVYSQLRPWSVGKYVVHLSSIDGKKLSELLALATMKSLKCYIDPSCPYKFNRQNVVDAFKLLKSHHQQGKIVVEISVDANS